MASDTTKKALLNEYFNLPSGVVKTSVATDFTRLFGQTPEESLVQDQSITFRSANAASGISFTDPTQFNAGTGIMDLTARGITTFGRAGTGTTPGQTGGGTPVGPTVTTPSTSQQGGFTGGISVTAGAGATTNSPIGIGTPGMVGGSITNPAVGVPGIGGPSTPINPGGGPITIQDPTIQDPICDYRYSFGCPVFSRISGKSGCSVYLPVYRTCFDKPNQLFTNTTAIYRAPELLGYIDISSYLKSTNETLNDVVENGVKGKRNIGGLSLSSDDLRRAINDLSVHLNSIRAVPKYVDRPDLGEGMIGKPLFNTNDFNMFIVVNNLQSTTSIAKSGLQQPFGRLSEVADFWAKSCDLTKRPEYCIISNTFTADPVTPSPNVNTGPFVDKSKGKIEVFGSRKPTGEKFSRPIDLGSSAALQKHPDRPCRLAIPTLYEVGEFYQAQIGYPVYGNQNFSGPILYYTEIEPAPKYPVVSSTNTIWTGEIIDPNCPFTLREVEKEMDDPSDNCRVLIVADIYKDYMDGRTELDARDVFRKAYRKQDADCAVETLRVYHPLDLGKDIITAKIRAKTKGLFNGAQALECHHTSSTQPTSSKTYYYDVTDCDTNGKTSYFSVAYGHKYGSGSLWAGGEINDTSTRAIYSQYRLLALDLPETDFTFYTNGQPTSSKDVYVINFSRTGMSDRVDPGNWELALAELRGNSYTNNVFTGSNVAVSSSNKVFTFIDDSGDTSEGISSIHDPYLSYNIVSGSLTYGNYATSSAHTYGVVYPNLGIIVLDPYKMNTELGFNTVSGSNINGDNAFKLFTSISGSGVLGNYMKARNVKYRTTNHYMIRVASTFANFTNNPTWVSGSNGYFYHSSYELNPQTYITTIGLYNDLNELLAVAKLSKPINKSFENDVLIKIRLNW